MPLTDIQQELIRRANRRLALFGLFRVDDDAEGRRHRFAKADNPGDKVHKLSAQSLFDELRPELRFVGDPAGPGATVTISDLTFQSYSVLTPAAARATGLPTKAMQILRRSHLLEKLDQILGGPAGGATPEEVTQQIGGSLFQELLKHLDAVVGFDHPRFVAGLTRALQVYVPPRANEKLDNTEQIDPSALQRWIVRDVALRGQLVKYLMGLEDDDADTRAELAATLGALAARKVEGSKDDPPFHDDEEIWARQIDAILDTLADLKAGLLNDSAATRQYLVDQAGPWVNDVAKNGEYNFPHPDTGKGHDFLAIYRAAKGANDWVARFVRTEAMHSFLVCWLASKYKAHKKATVGEAAQEMFRVGIENVQGRVFAQSRRDVRGYMDAIDDRTKEAADKAKPEAQAHLTVVKERIKSYFLPVSAYTRDRQLARAARLFVTACQLAGGSIKDLHDKNAAYADAINALQQHVLKFCSEKRKATKAASDAATKLSLTELKTHLKEKATADEQKKFLETAFAGLPEQTTAQDVKAAYVSDFSTAVLTQFNTGFDSNYAKILEEKKELEHLFGLWCGVALEGKGATAGLTNLVNLKTVSSESAAAVPEKERKKLPERQTAALKARAVAGKAQVESAVPEQVATRLGDRAKDGVVRARLLNGDQQVGEGVVEGGKLVVTRADDTPAAKTSELADATNLRLDFEPDPAAPDKEPDSFNLVDLKDVSVNELFPLTTPGGQSAVAAAAGYDALAARVEGCHDKYTAGKAADAAFQRTMRAAKLAQTVLAAPRGKVNLDARDLSNSLGVMQEMVEKLGDPKAPGSAFANKPDAATTPEGQRLKDVNISEFYPLADDDHFDMGRILTYHYKLCANLTTVAQYLRELRELRDFFDAVADSDLEVEVVNRTLGDYAASALAEQDDLFFERPPLAAYMTLQAAPKGELDKLGTFLHQLAGNPATPHFQYPLVVLAPGAGTAPAGLGYPVFAADAIKLPDIEAVVGPGRIQNPPHLLWVTALLTRGGCRFGALPTGTKAPLALSGQLQKDGLPEWYVKDGKDKTGKDVKAESVHDYLRKTWAHTAPPLAALGDQVRVLKWKNTALLLGVPLGNWPVWVKDTLAQVYGTPGGAPEGGDEAGAARATVLHPVVFDGLPLGGAVEVDYRIGTDGAPSPLNNVAIPDPKAELLIDGRPVAAPWAPK